MVEKMKLMHITGPKRDIDRVMQQYLKKYEIHFENAMTSLGNISNVRPFMETNIYKEDYANGKELLKYLDGQEEGQLEELSPKAACKVIREVYEQTEQIQKKQRELSQKNEELKEFMEEIGKYRALDFEFKKMLDFRFIKFRFGRIPVDEFSRLEKYIRETAYTVFYECYSDEKYVWGVYFVPHIHSVEIDAIYLSFHFERLQIPDSFEGTPEDAYIKAEQEFKRNEKEIELLSTQMREMLKQKNNRILSAYHTLEDYCQNFDIRKMAACIHSKGKGEYYILHGWMSRKDAEKFEKEIENDKRIRCIEEETDEHMSNIPPTKLKNPKILKPFEMFVEMYGLPAYNEMDPTLFIALTYTLMFGIMFGDVGQGLCLVIGGFLLYRLKGMRLAGIISMAGIWSTFFGFMFGSVFGFEELIPAVWMHPMHDIMGTLMLAIGFGGILILIAMILNMINAIRAKEYGRLFFSPSGIAGFICYGFVAVCAVLLLTGQALPATVLIAIGVGIPLIAILLKEPLEHLLERKAHIFPEGSKVMFFVEALVELFDVVLSYATNTISFVRVGAFALSHAGMMGVVMTLAGLEKGSPNWIIIIFGNILVTGLEGLVVGIQVLRLEYYEMFSRFYKGTGKPFVAFNKKES